MDRDAFLARLPRELVGQEFRMGLQASARIAVVLAREMERDPNYKGDCGALEIMADICDHLGSWREG